MEIFRPISQVGCLSACAGVTPSSAALGQVRNGPPLAVSKRRDTSSGRRPSKHWKIALCSLSTGNTRTPLRRAASMITAPAITKISLDATAMSLPASIAASAGRSPAVPTIAISTRSASGRVASAQRPASPSKISGPDPSFASRTRASAAAVESARVATRGCHVRTCSTNNWTLRKAASPTTSMRSGMSVATFKADCPMEPVHPRITMRLRRGLGMEGSFDIRSRGCNASKDTAAAL